MKTKYFRVPYSRLRYSSRALLRHIEQEDEPCLTDRRLKRLSTKLVLRGMSGVSTAIAYAQATQWSG